MLYVLGDTHLSFSVDKKMDVFGGAWQGYEEKLRAGLSALSENDTLVLAGDTSWGMSLLQSLEDFCFLEGFLCKKLLIKGNHDYFWETSAKMKQFFFDNGLHTFDILHNNAFLYEGAALCGTRGWFFEEEKGTGQDGKIMNREIGRLRTSLEKGRAMTDGELIVFLHYPPLYEGYRCDPIVDMMTEFGVRRCYYGHLHGYARAKAIEGSYKGILYRLISADHVGFRPVEVPV